MEAIALAAMLEGTIGDPEGWPHPVRALGWAASRLEPVARRTGLPLAAAGALFTGLLVAAAVAPVVAVRWAVAARWPGALWIVDGLVLYLTVAPNQLVREALSIRRRLAAGDLDAARVNLGRLVSRRTRDLDAEGVARATVETVAENLCDAVVAPLFWFVAAGPVGAAVHRAANTLDSIVGYRDARYAEFGRAAARLDDLLNWIPARIAAALVVVAAPVAGLDARGAWRTLRRDGRRHESPNAGLGKAAVAGALGVRLGGPAVYTDGIRNRPWIGEAGRPVGPAVIGEAVRIALVASVLAFALAAAALA